MVSADRQVPIHGREGLSSLFSEPFRRFLMKVCLERFDMSWHEAEDAVADTFLRLVQHSAAYDPTKGKPSTYAYRILRNRCYHLRREKLVAHCWENISEVAIEKVEAEPPLPIWQHMAALQAAARTLRLRQYNDMMASLWGMPCDKENARSGLNRLRELLQPVVNAADAA